MRIKSGDMISREFPVCVYLICVHVLKRTSIEMFSRRLQNVKVLVFLSEKYDSRHIKKDSILLSIYCLLVLGKRFVKRQGCFLVFWQFLDVSALHIRFRRHSKNNKIASNVSYFSTAITLHQVIYLRAKKRKV